MRRAFLLFAAVLLLPTAASAQGQRQGGGRGGQMGGPNPVDVVLQHAADLKLTEDQKAKLDELNKALTEKNKPITDELTKMRESGNMDRETMMTKVQALRANNTEAQGKLKDILNAEQLTMATKFIEEATPARRGRGGV